MTMRGIIATGLLMAGATLLSSTPAHAQRGWSEPGATVRCFDRGGARTDCPLPVPRGSEVFLLRQFSEEPCLPGQSWDWSQQGVWVRQGCDAEFAVRRIGARPPIAPRPPRPPVPPGPPPGAGPGWAGGGPVLRCESDRYRYRMCPAQVGRRGVELLRQTSRTPCEFGRTWGWNRRGVWVDGGCSGEFRVR